MGIMCGKPEHLDDDPKDPQPQVSDLGICRDCQNPNTDIYKTFGWCQLCNSKRFKNEFTKWTSCNEAVDNFIQETQLNANSYRKVLEWIPYDAIVDVEYIGRGCYGTVFSATWVNGNILHWDKRRKKWARNSRMTVTVKSIDNSANITSEFFHEIRAYLQCNYDPRGMIRYYGITRDPQTNDYMVVSEFANGNLQTYLRRNYHLLNWEKRLDLLLKIATALQDIHSTEFVHRNLHSGNILLVGNCIKISDLGLSHYVKYNYGSYGVLPYVAPEILRGEPHTKASDVYSLAIVMCEVAAGIPPFSNRPHDYNLAVGICDGIRPPFIEGTPKSFTTLVERCWDSDPMNRPNAKQITEMLFRWHFSLEQERSTDVCNSFRNYDVNVNPRQQHLDRLNWRFHPQACYTSRLLNFVNLPEPTNFFTRYRYDSAFGSVTRESLNKTNSYIDEKSEDTYSPSSSQVDLEQLRTPSMALSDPIYTSLLRKHFRADKIFFSESEISSDNESSYSQETSDVASTRYSRAISTELERRATPEVGGKASRYSLALVAELQRCTASESWNRQQRKGKNYIPTMGTTFNNTRNMSSNNKRHNNLRKNMYHRYDHNVSDKARKEMVQTYYSSRKDSTQSPPPQLSDQHLIKSDYDAYQDSEKENEESKENVEETKNIVDLENIDVLQFVRRQPTVQRARREKTTSIFVTKFDHRTTPTESTPIPPIRV